VTEELRGGRYVIVRPLGEGSQAETFEAVDKREGRLVAIKRFRVGKAKAWKDVELAEREAETLASIHHELLPRYIEHFEENGALVLVMEHIDGEPLAALRKRGRASVADVRRMIDDASRALAYLHGRAPPIIHRDIKPANVIRRKDGSHAFVDFGAVRDRLKPEGGSTVVGTFGYMAPEQFQGRASPASDVYGVGATAIAMLTGVEPEDLPHKGLAIDVAKAVPEGTPPSLVRALEAMLEPDPERRAPSIAEALARARERSVEDEPRASDRRIERTKRRDERRARRGRRRRRPVPFLPRAFANVGLLVAWLAVRLAVGLVVPVLLSALSILFGPALRRAARACMRAASRAGAAIGRASDRVSGIAPDEEEEAARVRVADDVPRVRWVTPEQAQKEAMDRAALEDDRDAEAWAEEVAAEKAEEWRRSERPKR
jgi:hypothetical protein